MHYGLQTKFRVIKYDEFLNTFNSDRSHMLKPVFMKKNAKIRDFDFTQEFDDECYNEPTPKWPRILEGNIGCNLWTKFLNTKDNEGQYGTWMNQPEIQIFFCLNQQKLK